MDSQTASANPPTKTPVVRGARACTVCRQAKMKCVGAEDGTKRCQRCQRSGAECVFEKHRRGRKPGSKLSEASKMLRRLEKGLNNAKAKQPSNAGLSQASTSAGSFTQDSPPSGPSYAGPSGNGSLSGHQSDDDQMDEDEDDRPDEALYPANVIRTAQRSSFLDIVMNKEPTENSPSRGSPTDRSTHAPHKQPSQSPTRSQVSPLPKPPSSLPNAPKDPVSAGIIPEEEVSTFFDLFFLRLNPFINLFDPALHSPSYVRSRSPFLFTTMLMAICKFFRPAAYPAVKQLADEWCVYTFSEMQESVEIVQAFACMTYWKEAGEKKTWYYIGMASRMAIALRLNRQVRQLSETELQMLERRNKERTYLVLFVHDRSLSMQTGNAWMLQEDELVQRCRSWHEEGPLRRETRPEDVIVAAFTHLRLIGSRATDAMYNHNRTTLVESELIKLNAELDEWINVWDMEMRKCECTKLLYEGRIFSLCSAAPLSDPFHVSFLSFFQSHVRLFLNTFGLNPKMEMGRSPSSSEAVHQCFKSARTNLSIVSKDFAGTHVLRYGQESITVMSAYAAIVLLRLLRNPSAIAQLGVGAGEIYSIVNKAADAYEGAGHVTGSAVDSAACHARFLRRLVSMDQERARQQADQNGYRQEGVPPSFAGGLPPLRSSVGMSMPPMHHYPMSRDPAQHPQLAPLSIPGSSSHGMQHFPSSSHSGYPVPAPHNAANRGISSYGALQPMSESDDTYFEYMLNEVGSAGEAFFSRTNGTPPSASGYMGGGVSDYGYGHAGSYRDQPPMPTYGAHDHGRPTLPPMQSFTNGFGGSR
ncbi:fungal-specific transcription factor domain-containing protein [Cerioporus squamosus]|nr:fungal-specific transcription factor domain-containing protein [Cerioporus squamosus]